MLDSIVASGPWIPVLLWIALYVSDFWLTLRCARLYQEVIREHLEFEGSFELTPYFEKDVDELRVRSPRFLRAVALSSLMLVCIWYLAWYLGVLEIFSLAFGAMTLLEGAVHVRHLRNLSLFGHAAREGGLEGKILYRRWLLMMNSSRELFAFMLLFGVLALLLDSFFLLGGALACLSTGLKHHRMGQVLRKNGNEHPEPAQKGAGG